MPLPSPTKETADGADEAREALRIVRARIAAGGPGWTPHKLHPLCLGCKCMTTETQPLRGPLRKRESHLWRRDPLDWYVEPEWCSERLFELEHFHGDIWDPAAGTGRIRDAAHKAGLTCMASDIEPRDYAAVSCHDFLVLRGSFEFPNIVSNPPFGRAEEFAKLALHVAQRKVVLLLPANWVQGDKRSRWLETTPLRRVLFLTPRPSMPPGAVVVSGGRPGNGTTDYAWFIWDNEGTEPLFRERQAPEIGWCRR